MTRLGKQRLGYFAAPLVPALTVFLLVGGMPMLSMQPFRLLAVMYFLSFLVMTIVALPILALCFKKRRFLDCLQTGIITGTIVAFAMVLMGGQSFTEMLHIEQLLTGALFLASVLGSVVYWLVAHREPNQSMQPTAKGGG